MSNNNEYGQGQGTLTKAAGMVSEARADFTTYSKNMTDKLSALQTAWGGQGASAFFVLQQTWTEKQATIVGALDDFASSLTDTERINTANDDEQRSSMNRIANKLG